MYSLGRKIILCRISITHYDRFAAVLTESQFLH